MNDQGNNAGSHRPPLGAVATADVVVVVVTNDSAVESIATIFGS